MKLYLESRRHDLDQPGHVVLTEPTTFKPGGSLMLPTKAELEEQVGTSTAAQAAAEAPDGWEEEGP